MAEERLVSQERWSIDVNIPAILMRDQASSNHGTFPLHSFSFQLRDYQLLNFGSWIEIIVTESTLREIWLGDDKSRTGVKMVGS